MLKQVIVVRSDLNLSPGKLAAQVAHASLFSAGNADDAVVERWKAQGSKKVVLVAKNLKHIQQLHEKCKQLGIAHSVISDAGLTELKKGTVTCIGIGPADEKNINKVTGSLPLLK